MPNEAPNLSTLRTPLGRVRGLGSARGGTHHWWMQRVTSVALLPLTIWFVFAMVGLAGATYVETLLWIARPLNAVLLLALVGLTFHHTASAAGDPGGLREAGRPADLGGLAGEGALRAAAPWPAPSPS
jgi:succinate dehydrogenase / fumarate reductase membrane anchor subunit